MDILSNFSENLSELISDEKLTPKTLSAVVKIDLSLIYKYLRKESLPSLGNLTVIADYFECSADYLLGLSPVNNKTAVSVTDFATRFRQMLAERNLTRYKFCRDSRAKKFCFARQSVDDWFNGKRVPTVDNAINLAAYFGCTIDYLLGREN